MESGFKTVSLAEEVVGDAWRSYLGSQPTLLSVPAFLSWLGDWQPELLQVVDEGKLVAVAAGLLAGRKPHGLPPNL